MKTVLPLLFLILHSPSGDGALTPGVKVGADVLLEKRLDLLKGKRVGLITNQSGRIASGETLLDALLARRVEVTALFGPEHGIRGSEEAGQPVEAGVDEQTGITVFSLYGRIRKPTRAMLANVDVLVYDMQDAGVRFYTYLSTLGLCMEAAAEKGIPLVVLDRPNPLGGMLTDGPVLPDSLRSFVGAFPIPVIYGLTVGELATMANGESWLAGGIRADLTVVRMEGWRRTMLWEDTGLPWSPPSPNIRRPETTLVYPATCYIEATNASEGRGTESPFHMIGAPFMDGARIAGRIASEKMAGVNVWDVRFTPASSKFRGVACSGVRLELAASDSLRPVGVGIHLLSILQEMYRDSLVINRRGLARLLGDPEALDLITQGKSPASICERWESPRKAFALRAAKYFLYGR